MRNRIRKILSVGLLLTGIAAPSYLLASQRIREERPNLILRNLKYGPLFPIRAGVDSATRGINQLAVKLEDMNFGSGDSEAADGRKDTVSLVFGGLGSGAGPGGGVILRPRFMPNGFEAEGRVSTRMSQRYTLRYIAEIGALTTGPELSYRYVPQEDYYGEGPDTPPEAHSTFALNEESAGWATRGTFGLLELRHAIRLRHINVSRGRDQGHPTIHDAFAEGLVSGGFDDDNWLANEFGALLDLRDDPTNPHDGGAIDTSITFNRGINSEESSNFTVLQATGTYYIPLSEEKRHVVALRADATRVLSKGAVPFYEQATLGGKETLRGYGTFRFRGRDSLSASAEYRYAIWDYLDAALFADVGQVYSDVFEQIGNTGVKVSYGAGLRLNGEGKLKARLYVAKSAEDLRIFVKLGPTW